MPLLYACSSNPGKLFEFTMAAQQAGVNQFVIEALPGLAKITPPHEDGATYEENAALKARYYSAHTDELVFADDTGLEVDSLGGEPGLHSARYAGQQASMADNTALLLKKLANSTNRRAKFVTLIALAKRGELLTIQRGVAEGEILTAARGGLGFGYDPLFLFPPLNKTFAEISDHEKFSVSARGEAFRKLLKWLANESHLTSRLLVPIK